MVLIMQSVSSLINRGLKSVDALFSHRRTILDRSLAYAREHHMVDVSCYRFRCFIEQALSELEFLSDKYNDDLSYIDMFTHVVRGFGTSANEILSGFNGVFSLGDINYLLKNPSVWVSRSDAHIESHKLITPNGAGSDLLMRLSKLMTDNRKCILGISNDGNNKSRFMFIFHTKDEVRADYREYVEAAFHIKAI